MKRKGVKTIQCQFAHRKPYNTLSEATEVSELLSKSPEGKDYDFSIGRFKRVSFFFNDEE